LSRSYHGQPGRSQQPTSCPPGCQRYLAVGHGAFRLKSLRHLLKHTTNDTEQVEFLEAHPLIRDPAEYGCLVHDAFLFNATKETTTR
jgi:hypothetical protein